MNAIFMTKKGQEAIDLAFDKETREKLVQQLSFFPSIYNPGEIENRKSDLEKVDVIFSTWGMFALSEEEIKTYLPNLKYVFYAAGTVQYFAKPYLERGVRIFSAAAANAVPVAEYATAQIVLANKGFYQSMVMYKTQGRNAARKYSEKLSGNYGTPIGIIGAGKIGRLVIDMLKAYNLKVLVFDPFLPDEAAEKMGVKKESLETIFESCLTISNHLANNEQTKGMLNYALFSRMQENATFLNTGRGAQVVEADLVRALKEVPTRTAVLDVTDPEPVEEGHAFYSMDNVFLTPHIAGSLNNEISRMGQYMADEYFAVKEGKPLSHEVDLEMLKTMA